MVKEEVDEKGGQVTEAARLAETARNGGPVASVGLGRSGTNL